MEVSSPLSPKEKQRGVYVGHTSSRAHVETMLAICANGILFLLQTGNPSFTEKQVTADNNE